MARRKQTRPHHIDEEYGIAICLQNGNDSVKEGLVTSVDEHICGKCRAEFGELCDFLQHKKVCTKKRLVLLVREELSGDDYSSGGEKTDDESSPDRPPVKVSVMEKSPDSALNLTYGDGAPVKDCVKRTLITAVSVTSNLPQTHFPLSHSIPDTHVALEALQNTRVAVAQHGHSSRATELGALQSALYTLQQQQLLQLQIIQQLHAHILGNPTSGPLPTLSTPLPPLTGTAALTPPQSNDSTVGLSLNNNTTSIQKPPKTPVSEATSQQVSPERKSPPSKTVVTTSVSLQEPNTLELLQKHTEQALQNTMSGGSFLLDSLNGSGDPSRLKKGLDPKEETLFRHRCKFCGKVFGSDSALQIHVRSHTGERPFKCNVCGNRFTTKGNLKVHFQRHRSKYPHVKMNSNPVPEHLDALHPPLEKPSSDGPSGSEQNDEPMLTPLDVSGGSVAEDLSVKLERLGRASPEEAHRDDIPRSRSVSPNNFSAMSVASDSSMDGSGVEDNLDQDLRLEGEQDSMASSTGPNSCGHNDDDEIQEDDDLMHKEDEIKRSLQNRFTNFAHAANFSPYTSVPPNFPSIFHHIPFSNAMPVPQFTFSNLPSTTVTTSTTSTVATENPDEAGVGQADPSCYQDLLPKPGSSDNSWESLMEVTKASETSKLQQLVDNIENKLTDPNQCIICHRVLSCKSALQMHYRTHTGERPFKCKICGRAFTTKGNLKTHMGVHRVKPPLRVLHQCPVCHKQFTNSLVLQQHIRMHTGEPTDMLPEQIMANEIRPLPMLPTSFSRPALPAPSMDRTTPPNLAGTDPEGLDPKHTDDSPGPVHSRTASPENVIKQADSGRDNVSADERETVSPHPSSPLPPALTSVKDEESPTPHQSNNVMYNTGRDSPIRHLSPGFERSIPISLQHPTFTTSLAALENHVKTISTTIPQPLPFGPFGIALPVTGFPRYDDSNTFVDRSMSVDYQMGVDKSPAPSSAYSSSPTTSRPVSEGSADERSTPGKLGRSDHFTIPTTSIITSTLRNDGGALDLTPRASVASSNSSLSPSSDSEPSRHHYPSPFGGLPFHPVPGKTSTTCRVCLKTFACYSALEIHYRSHTKERPFKCDVCDRGFSTKGNMKQHMLTHKIRDLPSQLFTTSVTLTTTTLPEPPEKEEIERNSDNLLPRRPPGMPKHMCHICNKPFSSASALQIHMRTHTGDKPFKCTICGRAFTTKGNLKVHMGTHMWNNGSSRRGRRMSLDLPPLPLPPGKPGDVPLHRPDLYFQYFNPAYLNGNISQPKTNEISVIQTTGLSNGSIPLLSQQMPMPPPPRTSTSHVHNFRQALTTSAPAVTTSSSIVPADTGLPNRNGEYHPADEDTGRGKSETPPPPAQTATRFGDTPEGVSSPPAVPEGASWGWKIACNLCSKICTSSDDLEIHLKTHFKEDKPQAQENLTVPSSA